MKLSECNLGQIVQDKALPERIGHVVGLTKNSHHTVIPVVKFAGEDCPIAIHHDNLMKVKG